MERDADELFLAYGYSSQRMHVFLATGLTQRPAAPTLEEQDLRVERVTLAQLDQLVRTRVIQDAASVAAWGLLRDWLGRQGAHMAPR